MSYVVLKIISHLCLFYCFNWGERLLKVRIVLHPDSLPIASGSFPSLGALSSLPPTSMYPNSTSCLRFSSNGTFCDLDFSIYRSIFLPWINCNYSFLVFHFILQSFVHVIPPSSLKTEVIVPSYSLKKKQQEENNWVCLRVCMYNEFIFPQYL